MGRRTRLTNKTRDTILKGIRLGLTHERAAQLAGITARTFYIWKAKGQAGKAPIYVQFIQALKKAEVEGEAANIQVIAQAARGDKDRAGQWTAAAWLLERRHPARWAKVTKLEVTWQEKVIALYRSGAVTQEDIIEELGEPLAQELFESAGITINSG